MLVTQHCKGFPRSCLSVHEDSAIAGSVDELFDNGLAALTVNLPISSGGPECMIIRKLISIALLYCIGSRFLPILLSCVWTLKG